MAAAASSITGATARPADWTPITVTRPFRSGLRRGYAPAWVNTPAGGLVLLILTTMLARLVFASVLGLGIDESYMVAAGRTLHLSYFDHPPLGWWLAWAGSHIAGSESPLFVRVPFVLLFAVTTWLMFRLTSALFGACAGLWAAVMLNAAPVFGVTTGTWVLPDGPLIAALLGTAFCVHSALPAQGPKAWGWWLGTGACAGLALCSKYTALLSFAGLAIFLLTTSTGRRWLLRPHPYFAGLLALAIFSPVLVWNAANGWASFLFQFGRAGNGRLHPFGPLSTIAGEALFLLPWIWLPLVVLGASAIRRGPRDPGRWLLVCLALPPILAFLAVSLHSQVLFHWAAPGYLMLFPLLGEAIGRSRRYSRPVRAYLAVTAVIVVLGAVLVGSEVRFNWLPEVIEDFALGNDPDLDAVDWISVRTDLAARGLLDRPGLVVGATRWHDAGKIDYALGGHSTVICLGSDPREYGLIAGPERFDGDDVLIVAPRNSLAQIRKQYGTLFDTVETLPTALVQHAGRPAMVIPLFMGHRLHAPV